MTTANLERVRVEDMDDALKLELGALLNAGNSGEAISNLRSLGFFEVTDATGDIPSIQNEIMKLVRSLPAGHLKGHVDGPAAGLVRQGISLSQAQASDPGLWVAIAMQGMEYARYRWDRNPDVARLHVFGKRADHAWERLWWVGELLGVNGNYQYCNDFSVDTNATNQMNYRFVREKAWAIAYAQLVAHYNPNGKPGKITDELINLLSIKVRIVSNTVPLPTPFVKDSFVSIDTEIIENLIRTALLLIKDQLEPDQDFSGCGFAWPG